MFSKFRGAIARLPRLCLQACSNHTLTTKKLPLCHSKNKGALHTFPFETHNDCKSQNFLFLEKHKVAVKYVESTPRC